MNDRTAKALDLDLRRLTQMAAEMGGEAERQIVESIESLIRRDTQRALQVVARDAILDDMQRRIEERAIATIATRQPMNGELRHIVGILRVSNELERVGDLAKNIGKRVATLTAGDMPRRAVHGMRHMAGLALSQIRDVLDSFAQRDAASALAVWQRDEEIDAIYTSLFREILDYMTEDPGSITHGIHLLFCAKNLERMGDHAINIADAVHYMAEGRAAYGPHRARTRPEGPPASAMRSLSL